MKWTTIVTLTAALVSFAWSDAAHAQSSVISYQGRLNTAGNPSNGPFDIVFKLLDAASGGTQVGLSLTNSNVGVTNGLFTLELDFGTNAYAGGNRWLEISVRTNGDLGTFTTLAPRQAMRAAPLAVFALTGNLGPGGAAGPAGTTGQNATTVYGASAVTISGPETAIPGLTQTVIVPTNCVVYLATDGGLNTQSTLMAGFTEAQIYLRIDGALTSAGGFCDLNAINNLGKTQAVSRWSLNLALSLNPGSHTITVFGFVSSGDPATVSGDSTSSLQGELTVLLLKK